MANVNEQDKSFKKVRFYQDKILLETELNEVQDEQNRRFEDSVYDSIGNCSVSGLDVVADVDTIIIINYSFTSPNSSNCKITSKHTNFSNILQLVCFN